MVTAALEREFTDTQGDEAVVVEALRACRAFYEYGARDLARDKRDLETATKYAASLPKIAHHAGELARHLREANECSQQAWFDLWPSSAAVEIPGDREFPNLGARLQDATKLLDELAAPRAVRHFPPFAFARFRELGRDRNPPKLHNMLALRLVFIFRAHSTDEDMRSGRMPASADGKALGQPRRRLVAALVRAVFRGKFSVENVKDAEDRNPPPFDRFVFLPLP